MKPIAWLCSRRYRLAEQRKGDLRKNKSSFKARDCDTACSAVSAVFAELRAQGRLQLQAVDEQALLQVAVDLHHKLSGTCAAISHVATRASK